MRQQPLLREENGEDGNNKNDQNDKDELDINGEQFNKFRLYWNRSSISINVIHHIYVYFLICYWWNARIGDQAFVGGQLLFENVFISAFYLIQGFNIMKSGITNNWYLKIILILLSACQPFTSIILYNYNQHPQAFFLLSFFNVIIHGMVVFLMLCYYFLPHRNDQFIPNHFDQCLIIIYFIIYFLNILSVFPLLQPLNYINYKHLTFKLCSFSMKVIIVLFTGYLMVNYALGDIKHEIYNDQIAWLYKILLIKLFDISPVLCIWTFLYTLNWNLIEKLTDILEWYNRTTRCKIILCGCLYLFWFIYQALLVYPMAIFGVFLIFGIYYWILFECYITNILDAFIFVTKKDDLNRTKNAKYTTWRMVYNYLTNINDNIGYKQRLCILHYLYGDHDIITVRSSFNKEAMEGMKEIIMHKKLENPVHFDNYGVFTVMIRHFLKYVKLHTNRIYSRDMSLFTLVKDEPLLECYDFDAGGFIWNCDAWHVMILEIVGLFVIIPIFIISTVVTTVVCPIYAVYGYFDFYTNKYSYDYIDFIMDYKFWMLAVYMVLLVVTSVLFIDQWRLFKIWYYCQSLDFHKMKNHLHTKKVNQVELYHNYLRDYRMVYHILQRFFGSLSLYVMQYLDMMDDDNSLNIPTLKMCFKAKHDGGHRNSVSCENYVFDIVEEHAINC